MSENSSRRQVFKFEDFGRFIFFFLSGAFIFQNCLKHGKRNSKRLRTILQSLKNPPQPWQSSDSITPTTVKQTTPPYGNQSVQLQLQLQFLTCSSSIAKHFNKTMDITTNQSAYRFPLLKNAEIIECLAEAGIELTESELTEPHRHKEKVRAVFVSLVSSTCKYVRYIQNYRIDTCRRDCIAHNSSIQICSSGDIRSRDTRRSFQTNFYHRNELPPVASTPRTAR